MYGEERPFLDEVCAYFSEYNGDLHVYIMDTVAYVASLATIQWHCTLSIVAESSPSNVRDNEQ